MSNIDNIVSVSPSIPSDLDVMFVPGTDTPPTDVNLTVHGQPITNQGNLGSCTAFAACCYVAWILLKHGIVFDPSELAVYVMERDLENRLGLEGASLKDTLRICYHIGVAPESLWPYVEANENIIPSQAVYDAAANCKISGYKRIPLVKDGTIEGYEKSLFNIKSAMAQGYPVLLSFNAQEWFRHLQGTMDKHAMIDTTVPNFSVIIGGHAVVDFGYDDLMNLGMFRPIKNSWTADWGDDGVGAAGYALLSQYIDAFIIDGVVFNGVNYPTVEPSLPASDSNALFGISNGASESDAMIAALYVTLFDVVPDKDGFAFWRGKLNMGTNEAEVAQEMFDTAPAKLIYPGWMTNLQIAEKFYLNSLGRLPDFDGLEFWESEMNKNGQGATIIEMIKAVSGHLGTSTLPLYSKSLLSGKVLAALNGIAGQ